MGDKIVPEKICGVTISCICGDHDIRWSVAVDSWSAAIEANWIFYKNLSAFVWQNCDRSKYSRAKVESKCFWWFIAVCWGARHYFSPLGGDTGNIETDKKLKKIEKAVADYREYNKIVKSVNSA